MLNANLLSAYVLKPITLWHRQHNHHHYHHLQHHYRRNHYHQHQHHNFFKWVEKNGQTKHKLKHCCYFFLSVQPVLRSIEYKPSCPLSLITHSLVLTLKSRTLSSSLPVTTKRKSEEKPTEFTYRGEHRKAWGDHEALEAQNHAGSLTCDGFKFAYASLGIIKLFEALCHQSVDLIRLAIITEYIET